jgi:drug/metabolite transporter (DMT)-like permease
MPIFDASLAVAVLGETLGPIQIAGAILVLAGIALVEGIGLSRRV